MALMSSVRQATLLYRSLAAMSARLDSSKQYPLSQLLGFLAAPGHSSSGVQASAAIMRQCNAVASMCTTSCEAPVHVDSRLQAEASTSAPSADSHDPPLHLGPAPQFRPFAPRFGLAQCLLSGATSQPWTSSSARGFATVARKRRKMPMSVRGRRIDAEPESSPAEALVSSEQHGVAEQSSEHLPAVDARPATDVQACICCLMIPLIPFSLIWLSDPTEKGQSVPLLCRPEHLLNTGCCSFITFFPQ